VKVRVLSVPAGAYAQKLRSAIPYGHVPDGVVAAHDELGDLVRRRLVQPWGNNVIKSENYLAPTLRALELDGKLWALPMAYKSLALFYRRDLVDSPPTTTDDLIAQTRELQGRVPYPLVYQ